MESKDELEYEDIEFIWGVISYDDISGNNACLYTMNDIDITYNKLNKTYMLGVETAFMFKDMQAECKYLRGLLDSFTKFMKDNNRSTEEKYCLFFSNPCTSMTAKSIEELYTNFRIFVEGYCKLYENRKGELNINMSDNELYYIIKSKFDNSKYGLEQPLDTHDKAIAVAEAKKLKEHPEIISIKLMERLYGYEDRVIYEFERG